MCLLRGGSRFYEGDWIMYLLRGGFTLLRRCLDNVFIDRGVYAVEKVIG